MTNKNLVLIGMPGSGKSTIGKLLGTQLNRSFIDTDELIETRAKCSLQNIVDKYGYLHLRQLEEQELLRLNVENYIIATGGSAVYSSAGMEHLQANGIIIYLQISYATMLTRINNLESRGLAKSNAQSLEAMFNERETFYERYANFAIDGETSDQKQLCKIAIKYIS